MQEITHVIFRDLSRVLDIYYQVLEERRIEASQYVLDQSREFSHRMSLVSDDVQSVATPLIRWTVRSAIFPRTWTKAQLRRAASERADSAAESMQSVATASEEIGSFLSIITEIADKTNFGR